MIEASVMRTVWNDGKTGYEVKAKGHAGAGKYGQRMHRRSWTGCCGRARALAA